MDFLFLIVLFEQKLFLFESERPLTLIPVSIDLCTVRRDGAPDFRRIYVPIFGTMTILIISGAPDFSSGAHFLQGWLAQGHISQKKQK